MKRLEIFYSKKSVNSLLLVSFLVGAFLKLSIIIAAAIYYFSIYTASGGSEISIEALKGAFKKAYPSGITYLAAKYLSALIGAPLVENLIMFLMIWLSEKLRSPKLLAFFIITALMYYAHSSGGTSITGGITGAVLFAFMLVQYFVLLESFGKRQVYWFTVMAHFSFNLMTFSFGHILNVLIRL